MGLPHLDNTKKRNVQKELKESKLHMEVMMGHKMRVQNKQLEIMKLISETKMKILSGNEKAGETFF